MLIARLSCIAALVTALTLSSCTANKKAQSMLDPSALNGAWTLSAMEGASMPFEALYPMKKPSLRFDIQGQKISGSSGCNTFNGPLIVNGATIDFTSPMAMTRMMCPGEGEKQFMDAVTSANGWTVRDNELRLMSKDRLVLTFIKSDSE